MKTSFKTFKHQKNYCLIQQNIKNSTKLRGLFTKMIQQCKIRKTETRTKRYTLKNTITLFFFKNSIRKPKQLLAIHRYQLLSSFFQL